MKESPSPPAEVQVVKSARSSQSTRVIRAIGSIISIRGEEKVLCRCNGPGPMAPTGKKSIVLEMADIAEGKWSGLVEWILGMSLLRTD